MARQVKWYDTIKNMFLDAGLLDAEYDVAPETFVKFDCLKEAMAERGRLRRDHVVRQPGVRAGHEGKGRRVQPLHASQAVRHRGQMPCLRQGVRHRYLLGRGVLTPSDPLGTVHKTAQKFREKIEKVP